MNRRRLINLCLLSLSSLLLSQCGFVLVDYLNDLIPTRNFNIRIDAEKYLSRARVECPSGDCPASAVGLFIYSDKGSSYTISGCSGTLIAANKVLTNRHCIPEDLRQAGSSCNGRIIAQLPETDSAKRESISCSIVSDLSADFDDSLPPFPDWAILTLAESSEREPTVMNFAGPAKNSQTLLYPVEFKLNGAATQAGTMKPIRCQTNNSFFYTQESFHQKSPFVNISDCDSEILAGYSGAGYLNAAGELMGLHSFSLSPKTIESEKENNFAAIEDNFGGGGNIHCIESLNTAPSAYCHFDLTENYQTITEAQRYLRHSEDAQGTPAVESQQGSYLTGSELLNQSNVSDTFDHPLWQPTAADILKNLLPQAPSCLSTTTSQATALSLNTSWGGEKSLSPETYFISREFTTAEVSFTVTATPDGYSLTTESSQTLPLASELQAILQKTNLSDIEIIIPTCE